MNTPRARTSRTERRPAGTAAFITLVLTSTLFVVSIDAHAQTRRLETVVVNAGGAIYDRGSNDGGVTWDPWVQVPLRYADRSGSAVIEGSPGIVSDRPGRLWLIGKTVDGFLVYNSYTGGWTCMNVFITAWDGTSLLMNTYNWAPWTGFVNITLLGLGRHPAATYWVP